MSRDLKTIRRVEMGMSAGEIASEFVMEYGTGGVCTSLNYFGSRPSILVSMTVTPSNTV